MKTLEEQQKLSKSLLAACKAAGIENPKYIMQGASRAVYHSEHDPRMHNGRYDFTQGVCIDHPPYASDWQDSLLEWVEPQKTTEHVWSNWMIEPKSEPLADVLARHQDHVADGSKMIPSGIESLVCDDIAKRQQVGIAKYGTTVAENPLTHAEWLQHAYEECLDMAVYLKRAMAEKGGEEL